ncbi:MAG: hypothetical protein ACXAD7_27160 [Candidatus Kariarchaeaceae archaeon]|jgi:metal-dependent amidase/aminoacylase/carboxypeptidase family protein
MLDRAMKIKDQIVSWRRDFHMHPELGFEEKRTAKVVAEALKEMGIRVNTGVGKTGVVGYLGEGLLGKLKRLRGKKLLLN